MPGPEWLDKPGQPEWDPYDYSKDFTWMGLDRSGPAPTPPPDQGTPVLDALGFVTCSCKLDNGRVVVYNPACPVHQHFCQL